MIGYTIFTWITIFATIIGGLLAVPGLAMANNPKAKELLDKIAPFQGILGIILFVWGFIFTLAHGIGNLDWASYFIAGYLTLLALFVVQALLGFLLGYGFIAKVVAKNPEAQAKADQIRTKLASIQGPIGIAAILISIWAIIYKFI